MNEELSSHFRILKGTTFFAVCGFLSAVRPAIRSSINGPWLQGDNFNTYDMDPDSQKCRELTAESAKINGWWRSVFFGHKKRNMKLWVQAHQRECYIATKHNISVSSKSKGLPLMFALDSTGSIVGRLQACQVHACPSQAGAARAVFAAKRRSIQELRSWAVLTTIWMTNSLGQLQFFSKTSARPTEAGWSKPALVVWFSSFLLPSTCDTTSLQWNLRECIYSS